MRMESKIAVFKKQKELVGESEIKLGDDITKKNQELLNRFNKHEDITSVWYFNGHIYGTGTPQIQHILQYTTENQKWAGMIFSCHVLNV